MTNPTRRRLLGAIPAAAAVLALSGCDLGNLDGTDGKQYIDGVAAPLQIPPDQRGKPVDATGKDLDGNPLSLADYRGKVVMINVWASWCPPCRKEMPTVVALAKTFATGADAGKVQVIGVNISETGGVASAAAYAREQGMDFPSFDNFSGSVLLRLSDKLHGPSSLPSTVVLDQQGRVAALLIGAIPSQLTVQDIVEQVIAGG